MYSYASTSPTGVLNPSTVPTNGTAGRINSVNGTGYTQNLQPGFSSPYNMPQIGFQTGFPTQGIAPTFGGAPINNTLVNPVCNTGFCTTPFVNTNPYINNVPVQPLVQSPFGINTIPTPFVNQPNFGFAGYPVTPVAHPMSIPTATTMPFTTPVQNFASAINPIASTPFVSPVTPFGQLANSIYGTPFVNPMINSFAGINAFNPLALNNPFINNVSPFGLSSVLNPMTVPFGGAMNNVAPTSIMNPITSTPISPIYNSLFTNPFVGNQPNTPFSGFGVNGLLANVLGNQSMLWNNSFGGLNPWTGTTNPQVLQQILACQSGCCTTPFGTVNPYINNWNTFGGAWNTPFGGFNFAGMPVCDVNSVQPYGAISPWLTGNTIPFGGVNAGVNSWNYCCN